MRIERPVLRAALMRADAMSTRFGWDSIVRRCDDWDEDERQSDAEQHPRAGEKPEVEIAVHIGHLIHRDRREDRAGHDQVFWLDPARHRPPTNIITRVTRPPGERARPAQVAV